MLVRDFDFDLPDSAIAQQAAPRGESRLLVLAAEGAARHRRIADLPQLLRPGDLLVVNDTRVIPARLFARRAGGTSPSSPAATPIELLLVEKTADAEWDCLVRPGRRARPGARLEIEGTIDEAIGAEVLATLEDGRRRIRFSQPLEPHLDRLGHVPLPPYIKRSDDPADRERYQTVFAAQAGAIAAPTAGLHFTTELLERLASLGIERTAVTLHVGIGTFKPVTAELVHEHRMDEERWEISPTAAQAIAATRARGGRVVAVGTTVVRTLESVAAAHDGEIVAGSGRTALFITPGFRFRAVEALLTNFHLPQSTLLMLVCAFAGQDRVLAAYREALATGYRFYSYGDAMWVTPS